MTKYNYQPTVDEPVAELHTTDTGVVQLKVYGITVDSTSNCPTSDEVALLERRRDHVNLHAYHHPDREELRECRQANKVCIPAMRSLSAAYQRLLKVIESTKVVAVVRKGQPAKTKSAHLDCQEMLREGDKLYRDQFALPAHVLYSLQRNLKLMQAEVEEGKSHSLDLYTSSLETVEKLMSHYGLEIPHPAETDELKGALLRD